MEISKLKDHLRANWPFLVVFLIAVILRIYNLRYPMDLPGTVSPLGYNGADEGIQLMAGRLGSEGFGMYTDVNTQQALNSLENAVSVEPLYINVGFECEFDPLISFLKNVFELEMLAAIDSIKVERVDSLLPRQKCELTLVTYTFMSN